MTEMLEITQRAGDISPARIKDVHPERAFLVEREETGECSWAISALAGPATPRLGDRVLVVESQEGRAYIIGVLESRNPREVVATRSGAWAEVDASGDSLSVHSPEGDLVFEYDAQANRTRLNVPRGDLDISAAGAVRLAAGGDIQLIADSVRATGASAVSLETASSDSWPSGVRVSREGVQVDGDVLRLGGRRAELTMTEGAVQADRLTGTVGLGHFVFRRLETVADSVMSRAGEVRQIVEKSWRLRANQISGAAQKLMSWRGRHIRVIAKKEVRIDGEGIDLG